MVVYPGVSRLTYLTRSEVPTAQEINEVAESLLKGGTRYRSEKIAVVSVYIFIVGASFLWAFSAIEISGKLEGEFEVQKIENIDDQNFVLTNASGSAWHDVRIVMNGRYLATVEKVKADQRVRLKTEDFEYYFFVPRPWGHRPWERVATAEKPGAHAPGDVKVQALTVRAKEGKVKMTVKPDS